MITLEDIEKFKRVEINTLSTVTIYLMIKDGANEEGWSPIRLKEFSSATGMTKRGTIRSLQKLLACGLIEKRKGQPANAIQHYRTINED